MPEGHPLRYKLIAHQQEPQLRRTGTGEIHYSWTFADLRPFQPEPLGPPMGDQLPAVMLSPTEFKWEKYEGSARNWNELGKFFYDLNADRDELPKALASTVTQLCEGLSEEQSIERLYAFLQENTRYVSVQLGIGGWQTYDAEYVYKNGFGDCKALTNYMKGMLKQVGIKSYAASIYAGDRSLSLQEDFPLSLFNHVILCVPQGQDTTWLECTSSLHPAGYLGSGTEGKHALLFTPQGGKLVKTPAIPHHHNTLSRNATIELQADGQARVEVEEKHGGVFHERIHHWGERLSAEEQVNAMKKRIPLSGYELEHLAMRPENGLSAPAWRMDYDLSIRHWPGMSGSRIFLHPNAFAASLPLPGEVEARTQPVHLPVQATWTDSVYYRFSGDFHIESMPGLPLEFEESFGTYRAQVELVKANVLRYTRELTIREDELPPSAYEAYRAFVKNVREADQLQVVLKGGS